MPTFNSVQAALNVVTADAFAGVPVIYSGVINESLSKGTVPYVRQKVVFDKSSQMILGNTLPSRNTGKIVFVLHVPRGQGDAARNTLHQKVVDYFRSKVIGGATLSDVQLEGQGESEQWELTAVSIPFYFDN